MTNSSNSNSSTPADPRSTGPRPPFPEQTQTFPGSDERMSPRADHGETTYQGSGRLKGKIALITGADSGIGRAVALAYAREGADVLISYLNEDEDAAVTSRLVTEAGRKAVTMAGDISNEAHCKALVKKAVDTFGRIDILVNNAAFQKVYGSIAEIPSDEFDHTFRVNVYAMFYLCKAALPHMKPGSAIINTASVEAYQPDAELLPYATTKGAIVTFSKGLAKELGPKGIRVNVVAPGPVWTPFIPQSMGGDQVKDFGKHTLLGRPAQPAEMAPIYVLLASDQGSYITNMVYGATGGTPLM